MILDRLVSEFTEKVEVATRLELLWGSHALRTILDMILDDLYERGEFAFASGGLDAQALAVMNLFVNLNNGLPCAFIRGKGFRWNDRDQRWIEDEGLDGSE